MSDPADGMLPYQPWARTERINRELPYRGYDDPTAHCFVPGVPRAIYTAIASADSSAARLSLVLLMPERMSLAHYSTSDGSLRTSPITFAYGKGDSVGHWEDDVLVVKIPPISKRQNMAERGRRRGELRRKHIVERFTPVDASKIPTYESLL